MTATPPLRELPVTDQAPQERGDAARNRTLLIDAARRLIAERGADAVTTDDIAAAAGVGKGTLFRRFGSRAGLMIVLLDEDEKGEQQAMMFGPPPLGPGAPALDRLVAYGRDRLSFVHTHHALLSDANRDPQMRFNDPMMLHHHHIRVLLEDAGTTGDLDAQAFALHSLLDVDYVQSPADRARPDARAARRCVGKRGAQALRHMTPRWVLHVDLDQFQAAVEVRRRPELAGLPIIVGGNGDPNEPRKVVTCASYPARKFGVHAGMPLRSAARKCPDATFLPLDTAAYDEASEEVMNLLRDLGHPVEVWGWDEAYIGAGVENPVQLAEQIREVIGQTELSCSVGISDNKQRAKVATGFGKPAGIYQLTDENWMAVMGDLEVDALWGVGPKTAKKLAGMGITTVADLAATDATLLTSTFGPTTGLWLLLLAKGGGDTNVSAEPWVARSRSHVITFAKDLTDRTEINSAVIELARQTLTEIVAQGRVVTRVAVTVRTSTFYTRTKIRKLAAPSTDADVINETALDLLGLFELDRPIRLLGVRLELKPPEGGY